jgi:hypothetical protein
MWIETLIIDWSILLVMSLPVSFLFAGLTWITLQSISSASQRTVGFGMSLIFLLSLVCALLLSSLHWFTDFGGII